MAIPTLATQVPPLHQRQVATFMTATMLPIPGQAADPVLLLSFPGL